MDFDLTADQRQLKRDTIAFARRKLGSRVVDDDEGSRFPVEDWRKCADFGVLGWPVPTSYGGRGLDPLSTMIALEALGYGCADNGLVFAVNNHLWGCAIYILMHGTEEQKNRFLKPMCQGTLIGAHALSEPETGSDVLSLRTTAELDGDHYLLRGTKCFISNGPQADIFVVLARTGGQGGPQNELSAFLVTADLPGFKKTREFSKMGLRTTPLGEIEFDNVPVPAANRIGREGAGYSIFTSTIEWERSFMFASQVGAMERLLDTSLDHAGSRRQFGRTIGSFQAVAHQIADMKIRLELARLILYRVGWLKREGRLALLDATIAKIFVSESLVQTALSAVDIHGARGYLTDLGIERELRDALGGPIYAGTSSVQRGILAELLGLQGVLSGEPERPRRDTT
ncbi:acyl-CoA dehydrogenase family protein [Nonomuraea sp. NPDC050153]|uniref:acyl-CoA dehydrogenase family protein n=1 Tax=Nonomuraea sp. NPDC050153 TaxID=3364359 RepID=UPI0037A49BBF